MRLEDIQIQVGKGIGQTMSIVGMVAGWGTALSSAILTMSAVLPKNASTIAITGFGALIGSASNWLLVHARNTTIKAKADIFTASLYAAGQKIEEATGLDLPIVEQDPPPTIPVV
jgi:hypothetical protein